MKKKARSCLRGRVGDAYWVKPKDAGGETPTTVMFTVQHADGKESLIELAAVNVVSKLPRGLRVRKVQGRRRG